MKSINATEAKNRFGDLLADAAREPVRIDKNGRAVAVVLPAEDYEIAKDTIALGRLARRLAAHDDGAVAALKSYSAGTTTRQRAISSLGLNNYSQLLKALALAGIPKPGLPKPQEEAMVRDMAKVVRG